MVRRVMTNPSEHSTLVSKTPVVPDQAYWDAIQHDDREMLWHPYTSMIDPLPTVVVKSASGTRLTLADGRELVDGMASWWAAIHGYNVPAINEAVTDQLQRMAHVMFGGITHAPAVALGRMLRDITPAPLQHIFYADSGSVSVEVAMKIALQVQMGRGKPEKCRLLAFEGGYHGDTTGAMSLCDPQGGMHHAFRGILQQHVFAPKPKIAFNEPWDENEGIALRALIDRHAHSLAGIFIEPIVQGAGGMWFYHPNYLRVLREACDAHGIVLVFDEIATGFGRTGKLWACEHADVVPDVMCIGKALTGGYVTLAAVLTTTDVAQTLSQGAASVLMHGPTFMGNPLAVTIARTSTALLLASPWQERVTHLEQELTRLLSPLASYDNVRDVRVLGAIGVVQMREAVDVAALQAIFVQKGAWIRPFRDLIYVMPPYVSSDADLRVLRDAIVAGVQSM